MKFSLLKSNPLRLRQFLAYLAICVALLLLPSGWTGSARMTVATPLTFGQAGILRVTGPVGRLFRRLGGMWSAEKRAEALQNQVTQLRSQLAQESERRNHAEALIAQMGLLPAEAQTRAVPASLQAYDASPLRRSAVFNKGAYAGIGPNAPVIWNDAVAGRVESAGQWTSRATLIGDRNCVVAVRCERSRVQGVLEGIGGGMTIIKYIPLDADIKVGDVFVTSGVDGIFPAGLLVGDCIEANKETGEIHQRVVVKPAFDAARLEYAAILLPDPDADEPEEEVQP